MPKEDGNGYLLRSSEVQRDGKLKGLINRFRKDKNAALHNCLIIGLDFGTTYSGASWITVADFENEDINIVTQWPGTTSDEAKMPTKLYYDFDSGAGTPHWGFQVPADGDAIEWFKLLLLREEDMWESLRTSDHIMRARRMLRDSGKTAIECVADYLRGLWQHTLAMILKARRKYLVEALQFHVVLTVPAIWKDYARGAMAEAARMAGILDPRRAGKTSLAFAPEPEAAALASLIERVDRLQEDDVYVICDAGGGTVDVITYRIGATEPLTLHEAVEGAGDVCGGIFIDEAFTIQLKQRLGRKWSSFSPVHINAILSAEWEYAVKPRYSKDNGRDQYPVSLLHGPLPSAELNDTSRQPHIKDGYVYFSNSDIQRTFTSKALPGLEALVDSQISKAMRKDLTVSGILLVGGLGCSPYLYEHLEAKHASSGIAIWQSTPDRTRTAICRGAILKGLMDAPLAGLSIPYTPTVASTISRVSLGAAMSVTFINGVHSKKDRYWNSSEGVMKARNQMDWYVTKGDDVAKAHPIRSHYYKLYYDSDDFDPANFTRTILKHEGDTPPSRKTQAVDELCTMSFNLGGLRFEDLEDYEGADGLWYKRFTFAVEMVPSGASTEFAVYVQDRKLGAERLAVKYQ